LWNKIYCFQVEAYASEPADPVFRSRARSLTVSWIDHCRRILEDIERVAGRLETRASRLVGPRTFPRHGKEDA
jgi:hypothetical protein